MTDHEKQKVLDEEHLRLLRIGYLVAGGADAFIGLFMLIYVLIGILIVGAGISVPICPGDPSPAFFGLFFVICGLVLTFVHAAQSVLKFTAARALSQRRSRLLCQIAAGASCLQMPWGVLLAVFTFMVLGRDSVKQMFEPVPAQLTPAPARTASSLFDDEEAKTAEKVGGQRL